jgi:apolipoprotein N-acyltransferase
MEHNVEQVAPLIGGCFVFFLVLVISLLVALIHCKIFSKAGYPWALGLLMLIPIANIVMLLVLAFGDWPIHKEMRLLRERQSGPPQI